MMDLTKLAADQVRNRAELAKAAREGRVAKRQMPTLLKELAAPPIMIGDRAIRFTISTARVDRSLDVIDQAGWDLGAFSRNPVVMLDHGYNPVLGTVPIGSAFDVGVEGGALKATVRFDPADMPVCGPYAEMVLRKIKAGGYGATSVGFRPIDFEISDDPNREDGCGFDFKRQELLEFSIVTVPCNADCGPDYLSMEAIIPLLHATPLGKKQSNRTRLHRRLDYLDNY